MSAPKRKKEENEMKNLTVNHVEETQASALNHETDKPGFHQSVKRGIWGTRSYFRHVDGAIHRATFQSQMNDDHGGKIFGRGSKNCSLTSLKFFIFLYM